MLTCFSRQRRCVQTLLLMCLRSRGMRRTHRPASDARWTHTLTSYLLFFPQGKTFEMERKLSKNFAWHPKCFCCSKCATPFQNTHYVYEGTDNEIYCKTCFKKAFPENETPQIYADTGKIACEDESIACPRCNGAVFSAEQMEIKGRLYHKKCMSCRQCSRPISIDITAVGPDGDLYCNICCHKLNWPGRYIVATDTSVLPGEDGDRECCPRCNGKVFEAEKMTTKRGLYHKKCFACIKVDTLYL